MTRIPTSKKSLLTKNKLKQPTSSQTQSQSISNQRKSTRKLKIKNKISEIIQKSILYSDVNYEFK
jgi:hypothetical protein